MLEGFTPVNPEPPWWENTPHNLPDALALLEKHQSHLNETTPEGEALRKILAFVEEAYKETQQSIKDQYPHAFFQPSYEQSLLLNCWWTGYTFPVCFSANRIGKTTAGVLNTILWLFPNNPEWLVFSAALLPNGEPNPNAPHRFYVDHLGREVQTLSRPSIERIKELQAYLTTHPHLVGDPALSHRDPKNEEKFATLQKCLPHIFQTTGCWPYPPVREGGIIWLGAPDRSFHTDIILREWRRWLPEKSILKWSDTNLDFTISTQETTNPNPTIYRFICKSYESDDTKWSGAAVRAILLTEGITPDILNEVKLRLGDNAFAWWDYTPYEARNIGAKTALAYKVYKKEEQLPLRSFIFTKFSARNAPDHIIPQSKREDMVRALENTDEGSARLDGDFYSTSPQILSHLKRDVHLLPWSLEELRDRIPSLQFYRGLDPGYDHPTVCCFAALAPGNTWFIYRYYVKRNTSIAERCSDIIKASGNHQRKVYWGKQAGQYTLREVHPYPHSIPVVATVADFHLFKADEVSGQSYTLNYVKEGLLLTESTHMRPEDRALEVDKLLSPNPYYTHPLTKRAPAPKIFFLINGEGVSDALGKMESLFWDRLRGGPYKGLEKDRVPTHNDDELDATSYLVCGPYQYTTYQPRRYNEMLDTDPKEQQLLSYA